MCTRIGLKCRGGRFDWNEGVTEPYNWQATTENKAKSKLQWEQLKKAEERGETNIRCVPPGEDVRIIRYDFDYRNPTHDRLHYRDCHYDWCSAHYGAKINNSIFPIAKGKCRNQWYDCKKDVCNDHLWDKRTTDFFPGHDDQRIAERHVTINGECRNHQWQACMNPECRKHQLQKNENGFEEQSFLERNRALNLPTTERPEQEYEYDDSNWLEDATTSD
jgi:hypothetical protein